MFLTKFLKKYVFLLVPVNYRRQEQADIQQRNFCFLEKQDVSENASLLSSRTIINLI